MDQRGLVESEGKNTLGGSRTPAPCLEGKDDNRFTTSVMSGYILLGTRPEWLTLVQT